MAPTLPRRVTVAIPGCEKEQVTVSGVVSLIFLLKYQIVFPDSVAQAAAEITQGTGKIN